MQKLMMILAVMACSLSAVSAQKYFTRDAKIKFDATAANSPEQIEALSNSATAVLDAANGNFQWAVLIKGFKFEKYLMQEHFNENYLESDTYPKATFVGTITNLSELNLSTDGVYNAIVSGKMTIHGVTKDLTANGAFTVKGGSYRINAGFTLNLSDYKIAIPSLVNDKVAKEAKVLVDATLTLKQ